MDGQAQDEADIRAIIERQFASLSWEKDGEPDLQGFAKDFHQEARLFPAARPAAPRSVPAFVERMRALAGGPLASLQEELLGSEIIVFGNVAMAAVACRMIENGAPGDETVEMLLLVKSEGAWSIVAQAWDKAGEQNPLPDRLRAGVGQSGRASGAAGR